MDGSNLAIIESRDPLEGGSSMADQKSQADKFKEAAGELETDDDPERFKKRVGRLVKKRASPGSTHEARTDERARQRKAAQKSEDAEIDDRVRANLKDHGA